MKSRRSSGLSASELVAETLRGEILRGDILPGQALLQDHIAARFDTSQSSVREALRRLEGLALVVSIRNRGAFVTGLTAEQVEELYEIRIALELIALRHNFEHIENERLLEAEALLDAIEQGDEIAFLGNSHRRFHAVFYDSPGRKFAKDILEGVYANLTRVWADVVKKRPRFAHDHELKSRREHRELLEATRRGDLNATEAILVSHITSARDTLIDHVRAFGLGEATGVRRAAPGKTPNATRTKVRA